jgi:hypothetical protein
MVAVPRYFAEDNEEILIYFSDFDGIAWKQLVCAAAER